MCGILGVLAPPAQLPGVDRLERALQRLAHRGPDAQALLHRPHDGVALGHTRLSILDLDARANQPFVAAGTALVFNGEIFNCGELRTELEGAGERFTTTSDTEVIARGFRVWGADVFARLRGMFAIALWDEREHRLHLARDEFGIKPLCVLERDGHVLFASEVKAIVALRPLDVDAAVLGDVLHWGFPLEDRSLWAGVEFLQPGTRRVYARTAGGALQREDHAVWSCARAFLQRAQEPSAAALRDVVERSVAAHMLADVPVAAALSGGLDSSIVTAAAARHAPGLHAHTFTLHADAKVDPEVEHATLLASRLGLVHHVARLPRGDAASWLRAVAWHIEEPIVNPNALPGYALAGAVHAQGCKVVLVGEGADELFGGYPWYRFALDPTLAEPGALFDAYARRRGQRRLWAILRPPLARAAEERLAAQRARFAAHAAAFATPLDAFTAFDLATQLQHGQLLRVDRMFMAHGVEARVPFLYRPVLEAAAALPGSRKLLPPDGPGRREKVALGEAFADRLPPAIAQRPKFGARGTVDLWSTWLADGLRAEFGRCLTSGELRGARERLAPFVDWDAVARAPLAAKERFAIALLVETVDAIGEARERPDALPSLPWRLEHRAADGTPA
jgi:asparagine synthase (glutamine-hydrolysing)